MLSLPNFLFFIVAVRLLRVGAAEPEPRMKVNLSLKKALAQNLQVNKYTQYLACQMFYYGQYAVDYWWDNRL